MKNLRLNVDVREDRVGVSGFSVNLNAVRDQFQEEESREREIARLVADFERFVRVSVAYRLGVRS